MKHPLVAVCLLIVTGCASGDDPETVALLNSLAPSVNYTMEKDDDATERIVTIGVNVKNLSEARKREVLKILPHFGKLQHLKKLGLGGDIQDDDLKTLPSLPNLQELSIIADKITDEGLKHFAAMKNLEKLSLHYTTIRGPGFEYLKDFSKLEWLDTGSAPIDDSAMPHIVANFKNLKRLGLISDGAKVTPDGVMQLVDLHWLLQIGLPNDIVGPDPSVASNKEERNRFLHERHRAKRALHLKYAKAYYASRLKAIEAGEKVPLYWQYPFGHLDGMDEIVRKNRPAVASKPDPYVGKGWTRYPAPKPVPEE